MRRSYREDGKVRKETLGDLSHLPDCVIDLIRRSLQGETFGSLGRPWRFVHRAAACEIPHVRHHSLSLPRIFDVSPYVQIIKPPLAACFDPHGLTWQALALA